MYFSFEIDEVISSILFTIPLSYFHSNVPNGPPCTNVDFIQNMDK